MIKLLDILQTVLQEKKKKRDRCLRIADRKYKEHGAYKSGAVVRCRQGDIWKDLKEDNINENWQDTSWENEKGQKITLPQLLDIIKNYPTIQAPIEKIKKIVIKKDSGGIESDRLSVADFKYPIIIIVDDNGDYKYIIDGNHRANKAIDAKLKSIPAKLVNVKKLPQEFQDIWKDLKEELNNNHNQDSIKQVFEDAPELSNIGTIEQYTKYLETIFPDSKVKDIVYHRTKSTKFDKFNNKTDNYIQNDTYTKDGIYFINDINRGKEVYGSTVIPAIVNIKNPYSFKEEGIFAKEGDNPKKISLNSIDKKKLSNEDGILFRPGQPNGQTVVFEPEQTHILGSKQDIEGFQKYVSKTINEELIKEKTKETLRTWFKRQGPKGKEGGWIDCNAPDGKGGYKACGRKKGEERSKYPACKKTPAQCKAPGKGKTWGKKQ